MIKLYTIGHSNHSLDQFIRLLDENGIMTLVDVRSAPYSRYSPHFDKENLEAALRECDILYAYAGRFLGGRPTDPGCYKSRTLPGEGKDYLHEVDYPEVMKRDWFIKGIERLLEMGDEQTTAIMCSEENPAQYPKVKVTHIRGDGTVYGAASITEAVDAPTSEQLSLF